MWPLISRVAAILISAGSFSSASALDEMALYNRSNCIGALGEFFGSRYVFNSKLTGDGSLSVAETGENGNMIVYNKNGQISVGEVGGCQNQNRSLTASKKIAEILLSATAFIDRNELKLKKPEIHVKSTRLETPEEARTRALAENSDRRMMLSKLYQICKAAGDPEISSAIVDAEKRALKGGNNLGTAN